MKSEFEEQMPKMKKFRSSAGGNGAYGLGFLGALIYFLHNAPTFWLGVLGVIKAIFWPGILVYQVLNYLHV